MSNSTSNFIHNSANCALRGAPVLVVDDDQGIRQTLHDLLEVEGYCVYEATNGREALHWLRVVPDCMVVLLDLNMPIMDGFDVLRAIGNDTRLRRGRAFLVLTAYTHQRIPGDVARLLRGVSIPVVPKPFDVDEVLDAVAGAARQRTADDQRAAAERTARVSAPAATTPLSLATEVRVGL